MELNKILKTAIKNVSFPSYVFNASGPKDATLAELKEIGESDSAAIMLKSCTLEPREGNPLPRITHLPMGAIQSMGLPNLGYKKYLEIIPKLKKYQKPIIASIAGLQPSDFFIMVKAFQASGADLIEVNLSCPNIEGKPQVAYDFETTEKILKDIYQLGSKPIGLKLPPYYDPVHHKQMAKLVEKYRIAFITCINSVGNTLVIDRENETPVIKPKGGLGGLCGEYIKPIALANVRIFSQLLKGRVSVIGAGGVQSGGDAFEFLLCGADAVQVGTSFEKEGARCFRRISKELEAILEKKGYRSAEKAKGQLKDR